jgi:Fe-S cluster assembly protein SufD
MTNVDNTKQTIMKHLHWPSHWQPVDPLRLKDWEMSRTIAFPSRKDEDWKWLNFEHLNLEDLKLEAADVQLTEANHGVYSASLAEAHANNKALLEQVENKLIKKDTDTFSALNAALAQDGCFIHVPANSKVDDIIHCKIAFNAQNSAAISRMVVWVEKNAYAKISLEFHAETQEEMQAFFNFQLEIKLDDGARLDLMEVQNFGEHVSYVSREFAQLERNAHLNWTYVGLGSKVSKSFITVDLLGPGSETLMNGAYFSGSGQLINLDTQQNHLAPQAHSDLLYKGAAIGDGKAVWEGMIFVDYVAQQTDSYQSNRNLILDENAEVKTIPGLEINANDVSCSHGATVGRLNDDELFYSQSRGIPLREAEKIILEGFFEDVLRKSGDEALTESLLAQISEKFDRNHA